MSKRHHPPNRRATIVDQAGIKTTNCFVRLGDSNESRRILRGQYLPNAAWRAEPEWLKIVRTGGISWLRLFSRDGSRGNLTDGQKQVDADALSGGWQMQSRTAMESHCERRIGGLGFSKGDGAPSYVGGCACFWQNT